MINNNPSDNKSFSSPLIAFYLKQNSEGRFPYPLTEILEDWDEGELEYNHDYIQWLFPLDEESPFNPDFLFVFSKAISLFREMLSIP